MKDAKEWATKYWEAEEEICLIDVFKQVQLDARITGLQEALQVIREQLTLSVAENKLAGHIVKLKGEEK